MLTPALGSSRLLTLVGAGGVGKTRAAIRLGHSIARTVRDGVWLVDLTSVDDAELVPRAVAAALGVRDQSERDALDTVVSHVRERDQSVLVLDNCEHVAQAAAELADTLLRQVPNVRILATSRQPLGVPGERVNHIPPMTVPSEADVQSATTLDALSHYDAVRLFLDRAGDAGAQLSDQDAATVGQLVRVLEGVPLAIELAAARTATLAVHAILDRCRDPLRVLADSDRITHPHHHNALAATLTWSYELCSPAEQRLWARLSVFTGGFDLAAAEIVCADDRHIPRGDVIDVLGGLTRQSLITLHRDRYRMLETVRTYGAARLAEYGEDRTIRQGHRAYYRVLTRDLARDWYSSREVIWMTRIRDELPNVRAALSSAVATGDATTGLAIVVNMARGRGWFYAGTLSEARYWSRTLLAHHPDNPLRLPVLACGAWIAACQAEPAAALSITADYLRMAPTSDSSATVLAFVKAAYQLFCSGDLASAADNFARARDRFLDTGLHGDAHVARLCLATATAAGENKDAAFAAAEDCLTNAQSAGAEWAISWAQWAYGLAHLRHGDPRRAITLFSTALSTQQRFGDPWGPSWSLAALSWAAVATSDHQRAALLAGAAQRQFHAAGINTTNTGVLGTLNTAADAATRAALGPDTYLTIHQQGTELDYHEAITTALAPHVPTQRQQPPHTPTDELTRREHDIVRLLASDASTTNKEMAARLFISVRTVDTHIVHILRKLGLTSRAQIAVWAATHRR
ncbi:MAG TPA: LuxR C-terminal-related transcriptional regulator [Pseudonocardiaceae bacterium]|nr:LuxR C-terminal-related transcriptional regulator [Pseudonocardiaceae bacterium]